jgi:uncharacterized protein (DUF2147 family)
MVTRKGAAVEFGVARRKAGVLALALMGWALAAPRTLSEETPGGVWLLPFKAAVQIFDCHGQLCGRTVWLQRPRNPKGHLVRDKKNPDLTLRDRPLCGLTVLWGLTPVGPDRWKGGWLYNPDDGKTYRVSGELRSPDVFVARIYVGLPVFGETSIWRRVPQLTSEGWC